VGIAGSFPSCLVSEPWTLEQYARGLTGIPVYRVFVVSDGKMAWADHTLILEKLAMIWCKDVGWLHGRLSGSNGLVSRGLRMESMARYGVGASRVLGARL
jgi:hypothetical protein